MQDAGAEIFQTTECGQIGITEEDGKVCVRRRLDVEKSKGWLEAPSSFVLEYPYEKH